MKRELEVFFDYVCPFCLRGYHYLMELLPDFPDLEILWRPCESHPRPDRYGMHSDLCIQGMFFAQQQGVDLLAYHERMYDLMQRRQVDVENADVLADHVGDLLDVEAFREALKSGRYREIQQAANRYAFEQSDVWVLPAYRSKGLRLDSVENIGVTKEQLRAFLETDTDLSPVEMRGQKRK